WGWAGYFGVRFGRSGKNPAGFFYIGGAVFTGDLIQTEDGEGTHLEFVSNGQKYFTVTANREPMPRLSPPGQVPSGIYTGDFVVVGSGVLEDFGSARAFV